MIEFLKRKWCDWDINHWPLNSGKCRFCGCQCMGPDSNGDFWRRR